MNLQLWTASKLGQIEFSIRRWISFYAPLLDSLEFMGIDPVAFARVAASSRGGRDGLLHVVGPNVPRFNYSGELPLGLGLAPSEGLQYSGQNNLSDVNTLIWFEDNVPKSTPTDTNPFTGAGAWGGNLNIHIKHITKTTRILAVSEINAIQAALGDVVQAIPVPPPPPEQEIGTFVEETPAGIRNGVNVTFTISQNPNLASILIFCFGVFCEKVAATPAEMQYTLSGTGNKTITMGMAPAASGYPFVAQYVIAV